MSSLLSAAIRYILWIIAYPTRRRSTRTGTLDMVAAGVAKNAAPVEMPADLRAEAEHAHFVADQKWQIFHQPPRISGKGGNAFVIFWHGGGWFANLDVLHRNGLRRMQAMNVPVVTPIYTLAPLSTGVQTIAAGIDMLVTLCGDQRYIDRELVILGDSAGGWIALRMILALVEVACGRRSETGGHDRTEVPGADEILSKHELKHIRAALDRVKAVILFSAAVDLELAVESDRLLEKHDPTLRVDLVQTLGQLWSFGPGHFPGYFADLTAGDQHRLVAVARQHQIGAAVHSPVNGIDVLIRYRSARRLKIIAFCGEYDVLHPSNVRLARKFEKMDLKNVDFELNTFPGMFHVFMGLPFLPEAQEVWRKVEKILHSQ